MTLLGLADDANVRRHADNGRIIPNAPILRCAVEAHAQRRRLVAAILTRVLLRESKWRPPGLPTATRKEVRWPSVMLEVYLKRKAMTEECRTNLHALNKYIL